jgi:Family of unknown function (DUF5330)
MIRLLFRFGFWALLLTAVLPGLKHADVFKDGVNAGSLTSAAQLSIADFAAFCTRNPSACETGMTVASSMAEEAKAAALTAYQGVRTQFDRPDRSTVTSGIAKQ